MTPKNANAVIVITPDELRLIVAEAVSSALATERAGSPKGSSDEWLDRDGAARLLSVHPDTVRRLPGLPVHRLGRMCRYRRSELERYLVEGSVDARKGA